MNFDNIHMVRQAQSYQKMTAPNAHQRITPSWFYEQRLAYPHHEQHSELIKAYDDAKDAYDKSIELFQYSLARHHEDRLKLRDEEEIKRGQEHIALLEKAKETAERNLRDYCDHLPGQRIDIYRSEIKKLEAGLSIAFEHETTFTEQLLNDPDAKRKRLERQVFGGSGNEYSDSQMAELRSLKDGVRMIRSRIVQCQRDIGTIEYLASEAEAREKTKAEMNKAIPEFNKALEGFQRALSELKRVAGERNIRFHAEKVNVGGKAVYEDSKEPFIYFERE